MTSTARKILRTYATGMGIPYSEIVVHYQKLDNTGRGRFLMAAKRLEEAWQEELQARAQPGFWRRLWARLVARVRAWRLA